MLNLKVGFQDEIVQQRTSYFKTFCTFLAGVPTDMFVRVYLYLCVNTSSKYLHFYFCLCVGLCSYKGCDSMVGWSGVSCGFMIDRRNIFCFTHEQYVKPVCFSVILTLSCGSHRVFCFLVVFILFLSWVTILVFFQLEVS